MGKLLLLAAVILAVFWILKAYRRGVDRQSAPPPGAAEDMVRCAQCGVHLPRSESIVSRGRFFCSEEHRKLLGD